MRSRHPVLGALAIGLLALAAPSPAQAQDDLLASDWDATFEEAQARNVPVLFLLGRDGKTPWTGWFSNRGAAAFLHDRVLILVGHRGGDHQPEEAVDPKTREKVQRCPIYSGLSCEAHSKLYTEYAGHYDYEELPAGFLLRPDKSVALKDIASQSIANLQKKVDEAQFALGQGVPRHQITKLEKTLGKGDKKLEKDHFKGARKVYEKAQEEELHPYLAAMVEKRFALLDAKALEAIEAAKALSERERHETLKRIAREMEGREPAKVAEEALGEAGGGE